MGLVTQSSAQAPGLHQVPLQLPTAAKQARRGVICPLLLSQGWMGVAWKQFLKALMLQKLKLLPDEIFCLN